LKLEFCLRGEEESYIICDIPVCKYTRLFEAPQKLGETILLMW